VPTIVELTPTAMESGPKPPTLPEDAPVYMSHGHAREKWLALIAFVVVAATTALFFTRGGGKPEYTTAVVNRGEIESSITATGNCNAVVSKSWRSSSV
jgi:hypothetical protein